MYHLVFGLGHAVNVASTSLFVTPAWDMVELGCVEQMNTFPNQFP